MMQSVYDSLIHSTVNPFESTVIKSAKKIQPTRSYKPDLFGTISNAHTHTHTHDSLFKFEQLGEYIVKVKSHVVKKKENKIKTNEAMI